MTPTESPFILDCEYLAAGLGSAPYSALTGLLGGTTTNPGSAVSMMHSDEFRNIFLSPRSATPHGRRTASATNSVLVGKSGTSVGNLGIGRHDELHENMHAYTTDMHHAMHLHYNTDYQPQNTVHHSHITATRDGEDLHDRYIVGAQSPERDSLSVLAETSIASAEKEKRHLHYTHAATAATNLSMQENGSTSRTIYASEESLAADTSELSRIVKSEDSPTSQAQDNSFSFADISMSTPFERPRLAMDSVLSPITHKSPDVSMTPYMTLLTLDNSSCSEASNPASEERNVHVMHALSTTSAASQSTAADVSMLDTTTNRSLFGTSTKRKRQQATEGDGDHTQVYAHQPSRYVFFYCLFIWFLLDWFFLSELRGFADFYCDAPFCLFCALSSYINS